MDGVSASDARCSELLAVTIAAKDSGGGHASSEGTGALGRWTELTESEEVVNWSMCTCAKPLLLDVDVFWAWVSLEWPRRKLRMSQCPYRRSWEREGRNGEDEEERGEWVLGHHQTLVAVALGSSPAAGATTVGNHSEVASRRQPHAAEAGKGKGRWKKETEEGRYATFLPGFGPFASEVVAVHAALAIIASLDGVAALVDSTEEQAGVGNRRSDLMKELQLEATASFQKQTKIWENPSYCSISSGSGGWSF